MINIEDLGYTYDVPRELDVPVAPPGPVQCPQIIISGISRAAIPGSFTISTWALNPNGAEPELVGLEPILSRWHVEGCVNCKGHLDVRAHMLLRGWSNKRALETKFRILVHTRAEPHGVSQVNGKEPKWTVVPDGET